MGSGQWGGEMAGYWFVCGADMAPLLVRQAMPGARFVARARIAAGGDEEAVWGILLHDERGAGAAAGTDGAGAEREVVTDDGRSLLASAPGGWRPSGEPAAVLAAARYWELPPAYVRRLPGGEGTVE